MRERRIPQQYRNPFGMGDIEYRWVYYSIQIAMGKDRGNFPRGWLINENGRFHTQGREKLPHSARRVVQKFYKRHPAEFAAMRARFRLGIL